MVTEPWSTVRGSSKSLGERQLSHWTLHSGWNHHSLCFRRFHTCSVWAALVTHQRLACEEPTRWHVWVHYGMPFSDRQRPYTVSYWRHKTFLAAGVQWIWRLWCYVQAWNQTACHHCALVVVESSQSPSLEPSLPGLAIWGLDNCLDQGRRPCPCRGRRWYSPPIR